MGILEDINLKLTLICDHLDIATDLSAASHTALEGSAPVAAAQANADDNGSLELDAAGFPWDERIHASSKEKVQAGTWKYKRGVEQNVKDQVENEYRAAGYGSATTTAVAAGSPVAAPVVADTPAVQSAPVQSVAQTVPGVEQTTAVPGLNLPPVQAPVVTATPKVEMPAYVAGAEIDDSKLSQIATAVYAQQGEDFFTKLTTLFRIPEGSPVTALTDASHRDSFHRLATDESLWKQYGLVA